MNRQLAHHHDPEPNPCPVCTALVEELAAVRLALLKAWSEGDGAHAECARLPYPHYSPVITTDGNLFQTQETR